MGYKDFVIIAIIVVIIGLASLYIYKAKKSGKKCIGCPDSGSCASNKNSCSSGNCGGGCNCCCGDNDK